MSPLLYVIIWLIYLLSVVVTFAGAWRISRHWPFALQALGRIALVVLLLTPAPQAADGAWLSPALITLVFDQIQQVEGGWFRAGVYLLISASFGLLLYLGLLARYLLRSRRDSVDRD